MISTWIILQEALGEDFITTWCCLPWPICLFSPSTFAPRKTSGVTLSRCCGSSLKTGLRRSATARNARRQCEALGEHAMAGQIGKILVYEQRHQIELATALGKRVSDLTLL